jgi:hypothetical protein
VKLDITKTHFNAIQKALREDSSFVNSNDTWKEICAAYDIGDVRSKKIFLSPTEKQLLREHVKSDCGLCPLHDNTNASRFDICKKTHNEKLSSKSVFGMFNSVASVTGVPLKSGTALTPPGTFLNAVLKDIDIASINKVIIVENGEMISRVHEIKIRNLSETLFVYKGHKKDATHLNNWLNTLPEHISKVGYMDFDLAGIDMAKSHGYESIIVPADYEALQFLDKNKEVTYLKQADELNVERWKLMISAECSAELIEAADFIINNHLAYTQESLTAHGIFMNQIPVF